MTLRSILVLGLTFVLCGCALPQKIDQLKQDKARFDQQQDERAAYASCNRAAIPGTTQHLACRMAATPN